MVKGRRILNYSGWKTRLGDKRVIMDKSVDDKKVPKYLYHYTSISSLAMILSSKKLKLTPLNKLDDLEEGKFKDLCHMAKYCFVSSWTDDEKESIPLWKMYAGNLDGVRIKMKANPFKLHSVYETNYLEREGEMVLKREYGNSFWTFIQQEDYDSGEYMCNEVNRREKKNSLLHKVMYTRDNELLYPQVYNQVDEKTSVYNILNLGYYKHDVWDFQQEWRYIINFFPFCNSFSNVPSPCSDLIKLDVSLPFENYYLDIDDQAFAEMEITLAPKMNEGDKIIVKKLVEEYNPNAVNKIIDSNLTGKIR